MKDLLTSALEAQGGLSRWREIEAFQLKVSIGGGLWRLKGLPDGLRDGTLRIQAHRPIVTITPLGGEAPDPIYRVKMARLPSEGHWPLAKLEVLSQVQIVAAQTWPLSSHTTA